VPDAFVCCCMVCIVIEMESAWVQVLVTDQVMSVCCWILAALLRCRLSCAGIHYRAVDCSVISTVRIGTWRLGCNTFVLNPTALVVLAAACYTNCCLR
jgi:hypothetical protein